MLWGPCSAPVGETLAETPGSPSAPGGEHVTSCVSSQVGTGLGQLLGKAQEVTQEFCSPCSCCGHL